MFSDKLPIVESDHECFSQSAAIAVLQYTAACLRPLRWRSELEPLGAESNATIL